ncbi:glyoxalase [Fulvivirga sp. RKSG066]|uniref:VOC family protein n=1 Tax=Fulvivirga aurantia TaxID=2529383 RepID=UPI0012BB52DC|nr:VOC family protein [Fulvivirga aurantia]MTI23192.1 glyoxalase [Fulvivirga aurantia]
MVTLEPIIGVDNVRQSAIWYEKLLSLKPTHGGDAFEILKNTAGDTVLCLHKWGEHDHPTLTNPKPVAGNGLILYFKVAQVDAIYEKAMALKASIKITLHQNPNSHLREFSLEDPDGYYLTISSTE